jgi:hypothetical protein
MNSVFYIFHLTKITWSKWLSVEPATDVLPRGNEYSTHVTVLGEVSSEPHRVEVDELQRGPAYAEDGHDDEHHPDYL